MIWLYLLPVAATAVGLVLLPVADHAWLAVAGLASWAIMAVSYLPVLRLSRLSLAGPSACR